MVNSDNTSVENQPIGAAIAQRFMNTTVTKSKAVVVAEDDHIEEKTPQQKHDDWVEDMKQAITTEDNPLWKTQLERKLKEALKCRGQYLLKSE